MDKIIKIVYDDSSQELMYPLKGESSVDFYKRMERLRKIRDSRMTEKDKEVARNLLNGGPIPVAEDLDN